MDYKAYALMAILMASVASVAFVGAAYAQTTTLTVETDADSYATGDDITISGQVVATNINQPIVLQVFDPQGNRDRIDQVEVASDGSYSYMFRAGGLMDTSGEYTVVVNYRTTEEETTFQFAAEGGWQDIDLMIDGEAHEVEYMITGTGNSLDSLTGDFESKTVTAMLTSASAGTLSLRFSEDIFDADDVFTAIVDDVPSDEEFPSGPGATNTLNIDFEAGTEQVDIIGTFLVPEFGAIAAIILAVAIVGIIVATARYGKFNFAPRL